MVYEPTRGAEQVAGATSRSRGHQDPELTAHGGGAQIPDGGIFAAFRDPGRGGKPPRGPGGELAFGSDEHQTYGNEGAKQAGYTGTFAPVANSTYAYELTQGDISMLSGDYFDPRATDAKGGPIADNLWAIAAKKSNKPGEQIGTQDEILHAIHHATGGKDPRFHGTGVWAKLKIDKSAPIHTIVNERYLRLASVNFEHFAEPRGPGSGGPTSKNRETAGGSYRALHESALLLARDAKKSGKPINEAMAHEAAASHFMQDAFSAGHVRAPRASIQDYWNARYPLFFEQFKKSIAQEVAIWINKNQTNLPTVLGTVNDILKGVLEGIDQETAGLPPLGFSAIPGVITHDVDNDEGVFVANDLKQTWEATGDGHGGVRPNKDPKKAQAEADTRKYVTQAVQLGVQDVQHAYDADPSLGDAQLFAHVRATSTAPAIANQPKYAPEQAFPHVDPNAKQGTLTWKVADFATLWKTPVRTDRPDITYGARIEKSVKKGGDFYDQLTGLGDKFDAKPVKKAGATLRVGEAYKQGFRDPMFKDPQVRIQEVLDYNPGKGSASSGSDDATINDLDRLHQLGAKEAGKPSDPDSPDFSTSKARFLSFTQRVQYLKNIEGGAANRDEALAIYSLFGTAPSGKEALRVYEAVHGKFKGVGRTASRFSKMFQGNEDLLTTLEYLFLQES